MKFYLLAAYLIASITVQSQSIEGTWRVSHAQTIDSSALSVEVDTRSTDQYYISPAFITYHKLSGLLEVSKNKVISHSFVNEPESVKLEKKRGNSTFKANGLRVSVDNHSPDSLVLRVKKEPNDFMILYPFQNSKGEIQLKDFENSHWVTSSNYDFFNGWTLHFLDSGQVNVVIQREHFGTTSFATYKVHKSNQYHCLQITDRHNMLDDFIFYLKNRDGDSLSFIIDHQNMDHPTESQVVLTKTEGITNSQQQQIYTELIGKWNFEMFSSNITTYIFDSLIDLNYSIDLRLDSTFRLTNQAEYIESGSVSSYQQNLTGKWQLSTTADFITLISEDNPLLQKHLTIYELRDQELTIDLSYSFDEYSTVQSRMKMKKDPNNR
ncbi:hypothetical protein [Reichenbachiella versicolor]|uniref:hypothetical protein n=1 Tax=Reichenbachiella versicolor TaxID=1821036 RepID=UPI000D6E0FA5|nr:hypothetical protein [Reichenbachiella versicolor]